MRIEDLIAAMTLEEQVSLLSGEDFWSLPAVERLGIAKLRVSDGPNGARGGGGLLGGVKAAAFPVGISLGSSWNVDLLREVGVALAHETKSKGAHMLLAPTVNIQRSVTNGRNFECFSEDPILTGELGAAYIQGLQSQGISATVKHFAGNESEIERTSMSSVIDERSLREVYLVPFEMAVKKGGTKGVMTAYNKVNGTFASEHNWLITDVLRGQWGFDGLVMSDWFGSHSTAPTVNAGLDMEMPGPPRDRGAKLIAAVEAGEVSRETIAARVRAILSVMEWTGALTDRRPFEEIADDRAETRALIRRAGAEGMVLLKNDGLLPLAQGPKVAVIGPNARIAQIMGGGSSQINPHYRVSPWDGLTAALGVDALSYAPGCGNDRFQPLLAGPLTVEFFANRTLSGPVIGTETLDAAETFWLGMVAGGKLSTSDFSARISGRYTPERSGLHHVGIASAGLAKVLVNGKLVADAWTHWTKGRTFFEEGCDEVVGAVELEAGRPVEITIEFAAKEHGVLGLAAFRMGIGRPMGDAEIAEAATLAGQADVAVVLVGRNGEWDTEGSDLENIVLPGRQDDLIRAVARANPRTVVVLQTGGPVEMPWLDSVSAVVQAWYAGQETGNAIADVLTGLTEPGGRLAQSFPKRWSDNPAFSQDKRVYPGLDGEVEYREGVFVGYRHYEQHGIQPLFPFGFGLSYTRFDHGAPVLDRSGLATGALRATIQVRNVGDRAGATVVQFYVAPAAAVVSRPKKELKAFGKLALGPGETGQVELELDARAFAYFDTASGCWVAEAGSYQVLIGTDAETMLSTETVILPEKLVMRP
ncbi:MAG: glycoside hydrolase family 3 C-terminal domain-containing protein [Devosia sp.]|uniref:beta-glucosidase n=1 Tax=Devosia sp. TaxID=1871048 RepID=UPI0024C92BC0|nr:glycoside hydrolase family 3 C-terminal domain-containing protein [Devosia sp.]UYN98576.1 MAG: glycoside hydrolase family 3 C-terminal domain-containing protein [Devosia sp.]